MFYCGFDPGFEAYLANHHQDSIPAPRSFVWTAAGLFALTFGGLCALALA